MGGVECIHLKQKERENWAFNLNVIILVWFVFLSWRCSYIMRDYLHTWPPIFSSPYCDLGEICCFVCNVQNIPLIIDNAMAISKYVYLIFRDVLFNFQWFRIPHYCGEQIELLSIFCYLCTCYWISQSNIFVYKYAQPLSHSLRDHYDSQSINCLKDSNSKIVFDTAAYRAIK